MTLSHQPSYRFNEFELDPARLLLTRGGEPVLISPKAFEVLHYLVANAGRVIVKEELLRAVWPDSFVNASNLPQHIFALRKALGDRAGYIVTIPGRGYQFAATVETESSAAARNPPALPYPGSENGPVSVPGPPAQSRARRAWLRWPLWIAVLLAALIAYQALRPKTQASLRISSYAKITHDGHPKSMGGTDGSRVYFQWEDTGDIAQVSISGGTVAPLQVGLKAPRIGEVSPDGSTLLLSSEAGGKGPADSLWSMPILGGPLRRLGNAVSATWSPNGDRIAYATASGDIDLVQSDGTETHRIATVGGYLKSIAWSPNGDAIRFSRDGLLWEIATDGTSLHQVLPGWGKSATQWNVHWDRDGRFFFVAEGQIWLLDDPRIGHAGAPVQLTYGPTVWERPMPIPSGKQIIASGSNKRGELVRFDSGSRQFQPFLSGISAEFVTFSNDRKAVAYVSYPEGVLWRAKADGSSPLQLTDPPVYPKSVCWSPDGTQIAFVDRAARGVDAIYLVAADGSGKPRRVLPDDLQAETDPSWSPDGGSIAFSTSPNVGASAKSDLRILDLASGRTAVIPASDGLLVPRWSPDGRLISAMTLDTTGMRLFNLSTHEWTSLDTGAVAFPEWSRDSKWIYYVKWTPDQALLRLRIANGKQEKLEDLKGTRYTGIYSLWMGLGPDDAPMMLRDIGTEDIYALTLESK